MVKPTGERDDYEAYAVDHLGKTFIEPEKTARVTYRNDSGQKFRVVVRQKANAIGFRARLPGDRS